MADPLMNALVEAVNLLRPDPVTHRSEIDRLSELNPALAASLLYLFGQLFQASPLLPPRGEIRSKPSSSNTIAFRHLLEYSDGLRKEDE